MRWREERGATSVIFLFAWAAILITLAFAADIGRVFVIREQLRTAEEAAALAGVLSMRYMVEMQFPRWENQPIVTCPPAQDGGEPAPPSDPNCVSVEHWVAVEPVVITGPEAEVWPNLWSLWSGECSGENLRCDEQYMDQATPRCWIEPLADEANVRSVAREIFGRNKRWGDQASMKGTITVKLDARNRAGKPVALTNRPERFLVGIESVLVMKTYLLATIGIESLQVSTPGDLTTAEMVRRGEFPEAVLNGKPVKSPCEV